MTGVGAAINTAKIRPGSSVAVIGCGGVGVNVIQGARIAGAAEIVAIDLAPAKLAGAAAFGATHGSHPDGVRELLEQLTGGHGFDYVFEVIGTSATTRSAWDLTRRGGTTVIVGAAGPEVTTAFNAMELFASDKTLIGSLYGAADVRRDFDRLIRLWRTGKLNLTGLVTRRVTLDGLPDAVAALGDGTTLRTLIEF